MTIKIQDKDIEVKSRIDFEDIVEKAFYALKIEEWMQSKNRWEFVTFEEAFRKYGV